MKRILITGASGFAGSHLIENLFKDKNYQLYGTVFGQDNDLSKFLPDAQILPVDLTDAASTNKAVELSNPDWVIHLAGFTAPSVSFEKKQQALTLNINIQLNLLESLRLLKEIPEKILIIGSAEAYGLVKSGESPVNENQPLRPMSPYGVSKVSQEFLGLEYFYAYQLPVVVLRPFNHIGERQTPDFVLPNFAKQIAQIEAGQLEPVLRVGNLDPIRDFTDVKDMVKAYHLAWQQAKPGQVYNLGSGVGVTIQSLLDLLLKQAKVKIQVETDPNRYREAEVPELIADASKFKKLTGWQPQIPLADTVSRVLNYWRIKVESNK